MWVQSESAAVVRRLVDASAPGDREALGTLPADDAEIRGELGRGVVARIEPVRRRPAEGCRVGPAIPPS